LECGLACILFKFEDWTSRQLGVLPRGLRRGEVREDSVLPREWSEVEGGYASRAACLHRIRSIRQGCRLATSALCRRTSDLSSLVTATGQKATLQFGSSEMQTQLPPLEYVASKGLTRCACRCRRASCARPSWSPPRRRPECGDDRARGGDMQRPDVPHLLGRSSGVVRSEWMTSHTTSAMKTSCTAGMAEPCRRCRSKFLRRWCETPRT
jgi:hypothetical protein